MSPELWITIAIFIMGYLITALIGWGKLTQKIDNMGTATDQKIALVKQDLENHKYNHARLELQVADHENKIDERLKEMNEKIDDNHTIITDRLTDIKVAIERIKK